MLWLLTRNSWIFAGNFCISAPKRKMIFEIANIIVLSWCISVNAGHSDVNFLVHQRVFLPHLIPSTDNSTLKNIFPPSNFLLNYQWKSEYPNHFLSNKKRTFRIVALEKITDHILLPSFYCLYFLGGIEYVAFYLIS